MRDHSTLMYRVHFAWAGFKLTTLVVIGTDCISSYKWSYHTITTTTAHLEMHNSDTLVSSTNKTGRHDIAEILLKVALSTITLNPNAYICKLLTSISLRKPRSKWYYSWAGFKLTTLVVIGTDCISSYKWSYHTITTTTAHLEMHNIDCDMCELKVYLLRNNQAYI
jgi:hypothetical protein